MWTSRLNWVCSAGSVSYRNSSQHTHEQLDTMRKTTYTARPLKLDRSDRLAANSELEFGGRASDEQYLVQLDMIKSHQRYDSGRSDNLTQSYSVSVSVSDNNALLLKTHIGCVPCTFVYDEETLGLESGITKTTMPIL